MVIKESRATRVQPYNEYRKKFNLKPYTSFYEFTGELLFTCYLFGARLCFAAILIVFKEINLFFSLSFFIIDDLEMARGLEELYGHIDALEYYPGLLLEKARPNGIFGESMVEMGAPYSLKGLLGNPICSPGYWKPSTFGGETGFNIIKTATLRKLVCLNTKWCPYVSFHVPEEEDAESRKPSTEL